MPTKKVTKSEIIASEPMKPVTDETVDYDAEKRRLLKQIDSLKKQINNMEKYKMYKDMGDELQLMFSSFMDSGFSREEAFELLKISITSAANMNRR